MKKTVPPKERSSGYPPEDPVIDFLHARACRHASGVVHMDLTRSVPASPWWKADTVRLCDGLAGTDNFNQLIHAMALALYAELRARSDDGNPHALDGQLEFEFPEE